MTFGSVFAVAKRPRWIAALGLLLTTAMPALAQCPLSFAPPVVYLTDSAPVSVAVGDFNADGRPDVAVANNFSHNVSVLLNTPIIQQPASVSLCNPTGTATFSVTAAGAGPFTYQWQWQPAGPNTAWAALSNGINLNNQATPMFNVSGATTASMNIGSISGLGRNLRCIVTNACGSVTSNEATLTIRVGDADCDQDTDSDDIVTFFSAWDRGEPGGDADADGDTDSDDIIALFAAWDAGC